jgi:diguanylate cyclase (GGDEF)-like protein
MESPASRHGIPQTLVLLIAAALVALIGFVDYRTGPDVSIVVLYLIPIYLATWHGWKRSGYLICVLSAASWFYNERWASRHSVAVWMVYWDIGMKLGMYFVTAFILGRLRNALKRAETSARTDYLTGAPNRRSFYELLEVEINRARRFGRPLTIAYMDMDDFKRINDTFGHDGGDRVLQLVTATVKANSRPFDVFARTGGDEFALILPETGRDAAELVIRKLQRAVADAAHAKGYSVTMSVGVVTCAMPPKDTDEMMRSADRLMFMAKGEGGGVAKCEVVEHKEQKQDRMPAT